MLEDGAGYDEMPEPPEQERQHVARLIATIQADEKHFEPAFRQMREDMFVARYGYKKGDWDESRYSANVIGQHVSQKAAILYAKNPKATAKRRETLDFAVWDESPETLMMAMQTAQMQAQVQPQVVGVDQFGQPVTQQPMIPGAQEAMELLQDFQQGMARRTTAKRLGKTLETLFSYQLSQQEPMAFKTAMKSLVRRTLTVGVGYVEMQFERAFGTDPTVEARLMTQRSRLAHLQSLVADLESGDLEDDSAEMAEVQAMIADLEMQQGQAVTREGLVFDFPRSTDVIPDRFCRNLIGWVGARHLTVKGLYTKRQIEEMFGVDLKQGYTGYKPSGVKDDSNTFATPGTQTEDGTSRKSELCCLYKHYDRVTGQVYYLLDGYPRYLRPPAAPDVKVEGFFPVHVLVFNECETEEHLFPPSDVWLLRHTQAEFNRSRDGKREHRRAARPRWVAPSGAFDEQSVNALRDAEPFSVTEINLPPDAKITDILQPIPVPGVDPNLYDVGEVFNDMQLIAGTQRAQLGGLAKVTATETAVSAEASTTSAQANIDDLDAFLTRLARDSGQILMAQVSAETVTRVVGPGAVWLDQAIGDIQAELILEVEAGSSGKPNAAMEIANWERMLPSLLQMPSIRPDWLAKESLRRLDDRMDLTEAQVSGIPAIVAQNRMAQPMVAPESDPTQQGGEGGDKNATPEAAAGSPPPMSADVGNAVAQ